MTTDRLPNILSGTLTRVLYQNAEDWSLLEITPEGAQPCTACGVMPRPVVGEHLVLDGGFSEFLPPGRDFCFTSFTARAPTEEAAIVLYLADITRMPFETILPVVRRFQSETINVLNSDPRRLAEIKGLDPEQRVALAEAWVAAKRTDQMMAELSDLGVAQRHWDAAVARLSKGEPPDQAIRANPWLLYLFNEGLPFNRVKRIAQHFQVRPDSPEAMRAAVLAVVRRATLLGNCYYDNAGLVGDVAPLIGRKAKPAEVQAAAQALLEDKLLYARGTRLYLRATYFAELNIPLGLKRLNHDTDMDVSGISETRLRQVLTKQLIEAQVERAVGTLKPQLQHGIVLVAAGSGGDQLTLLRAYRALLQSLHLDFELAAAGLQFAQSSSGVIETDHEVELVPDLLGIRQGQSPLFGQNNPLSQEVIVVFQSELLDVLALEQVLHAIRDGAALVLVGDPDSLPPLGPGAPFKHLWHGRSELNRIDMRGFGSCDPGLKDARQSVAAGVRPPALTDDLDSPVSQQILSAGSLGDAAVALAATLLPTHLSLDPLWDVQVVLPAAQMRDATGKPVNILAELNAALRTAVLGGAVADQGFAVGDKIVLMRDHHSPNIPGGTVGSIQAIHDGVLSLRFDSLSVEIRQDEDAVALAWAHTTYRLNGNHFPLVVFVVAPGQEGFLNREALYSGVCMATERFIVLSHQPISDAAIAAPHPSVASSLADVPQEA